MDFAPAAELWQTALETEKNEKEIDLYFKSFAFLADSGKGLEQLTKQHNKYTSPPKKENEILSDVKNIISDFALRRKEVGS